MNNKAFEIKNLPNASGSISNITSQISNEYLNNYQKLMNNSLKILKYSVKNMIFKPLTIYNMFFCIEIFLKLELVLNTYLSIDSVEKYSHNIYGMMTYLNENNYVSFDYLISLLNKIRDRNNKSLDFSKYFNFKYNKNLRDCNMIFNDNLTTNDIKNIEEVIKWLDLHI